MANLKEVRLRIASVSSIMQITSAMKLVSAAKIRRTQRMIQSMQPYKDASLSILNHLPEPADWDISYTQKRPRGKTLLVVLSSNKGLCGGFNHNVLKTAEQYIRNLKSEYPLETIEILSIGKKGSAYFSNHPSLATDCNHEQIRDDSDYKAVQDLAERLINKFLTEDYHRIDFVYNHFVNAANQPPVIKTFLPFSPLDLSQNSPDNVSESDYIVEPNTQIILQHLVKQYLKLRVLEIVSDSMLAEHAARMTSMHKATDNAQELIRELTLHYNKVRQASITNEIIEIGSSAEALHN